MAKPKKESRKSGDKLAKKPKLWPSTAVDAKLADLFSSSVPRAPPHTQKQVTGNLKQLNGKGKDSTHEDDILSEIDEPSDSESVPSSEQEEATLSRPELPSDRIRNKKRKRPVHDEDVEGKYLKKLALEEQQEAASKSRARKQNPTALDNISQKGEDSSDSEVQDALDVRAEDEGEDGYEVPVHESLMPSATDQEIDKAARTVFLGNVSTLAIKSRQSKKALTDHLCSIFTSMKDSQQQSLESIRFRSTAFSDGSIPKKAAFAKRELMDATTQSTNAYAVYSTTSAAREAVKCLNGSIILDRHLRVDSVAHPSPIDHRRCVFVGNLGFVDDESNIRANGKDDGQQRPKAKVAADIEEGLWVHFAKAGPVESVRVVRDRNTRVGKGIAYVQFKDPNSVEKALSFSEKKFPPMLPRKLRVTRARKLRKSATGSKPKVASTINSATFQPKQSAQLSSLSGRATKLLGRAGSYHMRKQTFKSPEDIIFEGHRAVPGSKVLKDGKKKKRDNRTSRSIAYRSRR